MTASSPTVIAIDRAVRGAFARPPRMTVSEWAAAHRVIVAQDAAEPGRWRNERTPYLRGIMDAFNDPAVRRITLMKAERVGGTEAVVNMIAYAIDRAPGPVLWIYPDEGTAKDVCEKRLIPTLEAMPTIRRHFTARKRDVRGLDIVLDRMSIACRGSNSTAKLEAFGQKYIVIDELDRCKPTVQGIVKGRDSGFSGAKLIVLSTPEDEWGGDADDLTQCIDRSFKSGDARMLWVPCPLCQQYHQRNFSSVRWIGDMETHPDDVARGAYFICPREQCGGVIHGYHNHEQLARCVWVPRGWSVLEDGSIVAPDGRTFGPEQTLGGKYVPTGASHASFHLRGLYTPFKANPYGEMAKELVENRGTTQRVWVTRRLGDPWSRKGQRVESSEMATLKGRSGPEGRSASGSESRATRTWFFPVDTSKNYFDQLTAEEEITSIGTDGRPVKQWKVRPGRTGVGNHYLDCRVGNMALVAHVGMAEKIVEGGGVDKGMVALIGKARAGGSGQWAVGSGTESAASPTHHSPLPTPSRAWLMRAVPTDVRALTAYADVQADRMYVEVVGWSASCARAYLIEHVELHRTLKDNLLTLEEFALRAWPMVDMSTGAQVRNMTLSVLGVDSGHFTTEVYDFCRYKQRGRWKGTAAQVAAGIGTGPIVVAGKGENLKGSRPGISGAGKMTPTRMGHPEPGPPMADGSTGAEHPWSIKLMLINTGMLKRDLFDTIKRDVEIEKGAGKEGVGSGE